MICNNDVNRKTKDILTAYSSLVGGNVFISIDEYLRTRELAVSELKAGIGGEEAGTIPASTPAAPPLPAKMSAYPTGTANKTHRDSAEERGTATPEPAAPPEARSDYDILRGLSDPWN